MEPDEPAYDVSRVYDMPEGHVSQAKWRPNEE